jgi:hypothetical protein
MLKTNMEKDRWAEGLSNEMVVVARTNLAKARGVICHDVQFVEGAPRILSLRTTWP